MIRTVAIVGPVSVDTIQMGARRYLRLGGVVTYSAMTLREHGIRTIVLASLGKADEHLLAPLSGAGVELTTCLGERTTKFENTVDGDARVQRLESQASPIEAPDVARLELEPDLCLIGSLMPDDISEPALQMLRQKSGRIAVDLQGYVRVVRHGSVVTGASPLLATVLAMTDFLKADEDELRVACSALGTPPEQLIDRFGIQEILETRGSRGGRLLLQGEGWSTYAAHPVKTVDDPTGAGDVFFAAYLVARERDLASPSAACDHASRVAALHVAGRYLPREAFDVTRVL